MPILKCIIHNNNFYRILIELHKDSNNKNVHNMIEFQQNLNQWNRKQKINKQEIKGKEPYLDSPAVE
jgi:hypothetical protein